MLKQIIETAKAQVEAKRQQQIQEVRQRLIQEVIAPHNAEVDTLLRGALAEMQTAHAERIKQMNEQYEAERKALIARADADKTAFAEEAVARATVEINDRADKALAGLEAIIVTQEA